MHGLRTPFQCVAAKSGRPKRRRLTTVTGVLLLHLALTHCVPARLHAADSHNGGNASAAAKAKSKKPAPGAEIFDRPTVLDFEIHLGETNWQALANHPRDYTAATVIVNGVTYPDVAVKLKGAAGSFRSIDDHPALTLHFSKWAEGRRVFGLRRLHLNNSVQDDSRMNEYIGSDLFRAAGVPTPRVAWATVRLNERKLGLYVLKEAFESEFLKLYFGSNKGNLYEGGFVRDIDGDLEKESGQGPDDHSDLRALRAAMNEKNLTNRWTELQKVLDVDRFVTYMALSTMLGDWDGYPLNRNNYRIYFRPEDGRAVFMPHGMDQLFERSIELDAGWSGALAWAVIDTPQGQKLYRERCPQVFTNIFRLERMTNLIAQAAEALCKVQPKITNWASDLQWSVEKRYREVRRDPFLRPPAPVAGTPSGGSAGEQ